MSDINTSADLTLKDFCLQDLYRTMLEEPELAQTLKDIDIIMMQNCMEEIIHGEIGRKDPNGVEFHEETREIMYAKDCVDNEFAELLRLLPFKNWKMDKWSKMSPKNVRDELEKNGKDISMELIDLWFFFSVMNVRLLYLLGLPVNEQSIKALYAIKWVENVERVQSGTFDKRREMTPKEQEMLAVAKHVKQLVAENVKKHNIPLPHPYLR